MAALALAASLAAPPAGAAAEQHAAPAPVDVIEVTGLFDPVLADFLADSLERASRPAPAGSQALVIELDSPGSVVGDERLREVVAATEAASVPVVVWVGESRGAQVRGGSLLLLEAADLVGAVPGARIATGPEAGAGTAPAEEMVEAGVVDVLAPTIGDLVVELDGRDVGGTALETAEVVDRDGERRRQPTVPVRFGKPGLLPRLLHTVASPSVAYLLLIAGLLLVVFEFFTAGVGVAGVTGAAAFVLGAYGFGVLPVRPWAVALLGVGILGYAIDVQAGAPRFWTGAGTVALVVGSVALYDGLSVPLLTLAVVLAGVAVFMVGGMPSVIRTRFATPTIGREEMVGEVGTATTDVAPDGTVELRGAAWPARTNRATPITAGDPVRVVAIDGVVLEVEPEAGGAVDYREQAKARRSAT